jgi:hypothetical protein
VGRDGHGFSLRIEGLVQLGRETAGCETDLSVSPY